MGKANKAVSQGDLSRLFFEAVPFAAFVLDPEKGVILQVNERGCRLLGRDRDALTGFPIHKEGVHELDWLASILLQLEEENAPVNTTVHLQTGDCSVSVEVAAESHDAEGKRVVVVTAREMEGACSADPDEKESRHTPSSYKALEDERDNLHALIDATSNPMMLFDTNGKVITGNAAVAQDVGMQVHEMSGLQLEDMFEKETASMRNAVIREVSITKRDRVFDEIVPPVFYRIRVVPVFDGQEEVKGVVMSGMEMTELVAMQREIIEKDQFHSSIINAIQDGLEVVDIDKRILLANETFQDWFAHLGPLQGKHHKILHEIEGLDDSCPVDQVLATGVPAQAVRPFKKGGKEAGWIEVFSFPLFDADGDIRGAVQYCRNITEKRTLEHRLRMERRKFREYYNFSPVGIATALPTGHWVDVNVEYCSMLGYTKEQLLTHSWEHFVHPDDRAQISRFHNAAMVGDTDELHADIRYLHRTGDVVYASVAIKYIRDDRGVPEYYLTVVQDITARKAAEDELRQIRRDLERRVMVRTRQLLESESNLRALLNAPVVSSFLLDEDNVVLAVNDLGAERLGCIPEEVVGRNALDFFSSDLARARERHMENARKSAKIVKFQDQRGDMIFDTSVYPIYDRQGNVTRLAVFAEDITRTHELERQLLQAHKMEALGLMAGGIAHDFNNILGVIITNAEMLGMSNLREKDSKRRSRILDAGVRAREIVKQMLTFSRSGLEERQCVDIGAAIQQFAEFTRASLPVNIEFVVDMPESPAMHVYLDPTQLQQLIMNLCVNAQHAMGASGGRLTVKLDGPVRCNERDCLVTYPELSPGDYARLQVTDTGVGIQRSIIERIFEPFFTTKPKGVGTGLGLAMVHGIVRRHSGSIRVQSKPGNGATFHVLFPLCEKESMPLQVQAVQGKSSDAARILFVDDDGEFRASISPALESMGYEVVEASSGYSALAMLAEERFGLVLTDQTMPAMSGIELAQNIRKNDTRIPILLCTGYSQYITEEKLHSLGLGLLMKPFTLNELARSITSILHADKDSSS